MVTQKAGGAMLGSTLIVMAWTGVYFSRHPRSIPDTEYSPTPNSSVEVYEIVNGTDIYNITISEQDETPYERRNKVKEVTFFVYNY